MEEFPSLLPEAKSSDGKDKKKKQGKRAHLRSLPIASIENESKDKSAAKPEAASLSEAFINVLEKKKEAVPDNAAKEKLPAATKGPKPEAKAETTEPTVQSLETPEDHNEPDSAEDYEELPSYEPEPVEFSGGEVILHLQGDRPIAERVLPLHAEEEPEAEPTEEPVFEPPIFSPQPEQQRQEQAESPEPVAAGGGGEVPPTQPPEAPPTPFEQPPEPPRSPSELLQPRPEDIYTQPDFSAADTAPTTFGGEQLVTKKEADDAAYYAARAGQNRGLVTGLLVGGAYEHFKHKRREKRQAKRFRQQSKQLEAARQDYAFGLQEQARSDQRAEDMERRFSTSGKRFENSANPEKLPQGAVERPKLDPGEQLLNIPADHRLETSAWHTIEVDSKTGKAVEDPAFQYGHEYYQERAQESAPPQQRNATTGEVALAAVAGVQAPGNSGTLPPVQIPDASTQGPPSSIPKRQNTDSNKDSNSTSATSAAPLWPWLVALAVVVICLVALLH